MNGNKHSSLSAANTDEGIGEFWDSHDFINFDTEKPDVEFAVSFKVLVEMKLLAEEVDRNSDGE